MLIAPTRPPQRQQRDRPPQPRVHLLHLGGRHHRRTRPPAGGDDRGRGASCASHTDTPVCVGFGIARPRDGRHRLPGRRRGDRRLGHRPPHDRPQERPARPARDGRRRVRERTAATDTVTRNWETSSPQPGMGATGCETTRASADMTGRGRGCHGRSRPC